MRHSRYRSALRYGVAAAIEHDEVPFRHTFATVIDVGAGRGQFALFALEHFPESSLHCFEPLPASRAKLKQVLGDSAQVTVYSLALGGADAPLDLRISRKGDSSSLLPITDQQVSAFPGTEEVSRITVDCSRLDDVLSLASLEGPCLLKIDVQGYELNVLRGTEKILPAVTELLIECSFIELYEGQAFAEDVICYVRDRGFRLAGISSVTRDASNHPVQADLLFVAAA